MSAAQFIHVLENELGWNPPKDRKKLQATDLEWMFISDDANKAFLSWICNNITKRNLLTDEELQHMDELKSSGHYLQGKELEDALQRANVDDTIASESAVEALREEVESLETTYVATKEEVSDLLRQREQLVAQLSAVKARSQSLQRVQQRQQDSFSRVTMAKIDQRSTAVDNSLDELSSVASLVAGCYAEDDDRTLKEAFMTGVNIVPYLEQEDACLREAQHFVQRRLASQTAVGELTDSSTVDSDNLDKGEDDLLQDPSLAFLRGVDAETHARHCRELARLQTAFATSEKEKVEAEIELARARASFETIKLQLMREQYYQSMDDVSVKTKISEYKGQILKERQLVRKHIDQTIQELIFQVSQLQSAPILWGDYNLKIARQRYKQHKVEKAISTLLTQQTRLSLISYAYNLEAAEFQNEVAALLLACHKELAQWRADFRARTKRLESQAAQKKSGASSSLDKHVVDLSDKSSLNLTRLLRLALPIAAAEGADPIKLAKQLEEKAKTLRHQILMETSSQEEQFQRARQTSAALQEKLFGSSTTSFVPTLTPVAIAEGQQRLDAAIQDLSSAMETIIREHQQKVQSISALPKDKAIERQLWVAFFSNPASLQRLFRQLDK